MPSKLLKGESMTKIISLEKFKKRRPPPFDHLFDDMPVKKIRKKTSDLYDYNEAKAVQIFIQTTIYIEAVLLYTSDVTETEFLCFDQAKMTVHQKIQDKDPDFVDITKIKPLWEFLIKLIRQNKLNFNEFEDLVFVMAPWLQNFEINQDIASQVLSNLHNKNLTKIVAAEQLKWKQLHQSKLREYWARPKKNYHLNDKKTSKMEPYINPLFYPQADPRKMTENTRNYVTIIFKILRLSSDHQKSEKTNWKQKIIAWLYK